MQHDTVNQGYLKRQAEKLVQGEGVDFKRMLRTAFQQGVLSEDQLCQDLGTERTALSNLKKGNTGKDRKVMREIACLILTRLEK